MVIRFRISLWPIIPSEYYLLRGYFYVLMMRSRIIVTHEMTTSAIASCGRLTSCYSPFYQAFSAYLWQRPKNVTWYSFVSFPALLQPMHGHRPANRLQFQNWYVFVSFFERKKSAFGSKLGHGVKTSDEVFFSPCPAQPHPGRVLPGDVSRASSRILVCSTPT